MKLDGAYEQIKGVVERNIVNYMIEVLIALRSTEKKMEERYGPGSTREIVMNRAIRFLKGELQYHSLIRKNKNNILAYGKERNITGALQRDIESFNKNRGRLGSNEIATGELHTEGRKSDADATSTAPRTKNTRVRKDSHNSNVVA